MPPRAVPTGTGNGSSNSNGFASYSGHCALLPVSSLPSLSLPLSPSSLEPLLPPVESSSSDELASALVELVGSVAPAVSCPPPPPSHASTSATQTCHRIATDESLGEWMRG